MTTMNTFKHAGGLLSCIDAVRNLKALLVLLLALVAGGLILSLAGVLTFKVHAILGALFMLIAFAVFFYGSMAAGVMLMDEAKGGESRPPLAAMITALATGHRLIFVMLLLGIVYLVGLAVMALILLITKIPGIGPLLFLLVFPPLVVISGVALVALYFVVFPLAAPAIWEGATTMQAMSRLYGIAKTRIVNVLVLMFVVLLITGLVGLFIGVILTAGTLTTGGLSAAIVGASMMSADPSALFRMMGGSSFGGGGYMVAGAMGGGLVWLLGMSLPLLVYVRGCCQVYLANVDGIDASAVEASLRASLEKAKTQAGELKRKGEEMAAQSAAKKQAAASAPAESAAAPLAAAVTTARAPNPVADTATPHCPACQAEYVLGDKFCGSCGHKLT